MLFSLITAVVSELIHYTTSGNSGGIPLQMPLIQVLVPRVMGLKEQLRDSSKVMHSITCLSAFNKTLEMFNHYLIVLYELYFFIQDD